MISLNRRLMTAASLVLALFLGVTGLVLDGAFRHSAEKAVNERLQAYVYAILAAIEIGDEGAFAMPRPLRSPRFSRPESGLYARIVDAGGKVVWSSASLLDLNIPFASTNLSGKAEYHRLPGDGRYFYNVAFGVEWIYARSRSRRLVIQVTEDGRGIAIQVQEFRQSLWGWLAGVSLLLLLAQGMILRWGLLPLRSVSRDLKAVEKGEAEQLRGEYPPELEGLTDSVNSFIRTERAQRDRYRHTLGDLAHSLKTPLAVLQGELGRKDLPEDIRREAETQLQRMNQMVGYQLQKASTSGRQVLGRKVELLPLVSRLVDTLGKVHRERGIHCETDIDSQLAYAGDQSDLMELFGNLLENAYKWSRGRVVVSVQKQAQGKRLLIVVTDDGPGIPDDKLTEILARGTRADETVDGHGIGLAIVRDIVDAYEGSLAVGRSGLGGAEFRIELPI